MTPMHRRDDVVDMGFAVLEEMRSLSSSLVFASLITDDGFEITHTPRASTAVDNGRFASMTSSVQALSDAVGRELRIGAGEYVVIAAENGYALQLRVPGHPVILSALFETNETLGKALYVSRRGAARLSAALTSAALTSTATSTPPASLTHQEQDTPA